MGRKLMFTAQQVVDAVTEARGLLTVAAVKLGCSVDTIENYMKRYPEVERARHYAREGLLDFAEGQLFRNIANGDTTSIIFYLKTQGKKRGYIEHLRQEITGQDGGDIRLNVTSLTDDQRIETIYRLVETARARLTGDTIDADQPVAIDGESGTDSTAR